MSVSLIGIGQIREKVKEEKNKFQMTKKLIVFGDNSVKNEDSLINILCERTGTTAIINSANYTIENFFNYGFPSKFYNSNELYDNKSMYINVGRNDMSLYPCDSYAYVPDSLISLRNHVLSMLFMCTIPPKYYYPADTLFKSADDWVKDGHHPGSIKTFSVNPFVDTITLATNININARYYVMILYVEFDIYTQSENIDVNVLLDNKVEASINIPRYGVNYTRSRIIPYCVVLDMLDTKYRSLSIEMKSKFGNTTVGIFGVYGFNDDVKDCRNVLVDGFGYNYHEINHYQSISSLDVITRTQTRYNNIFTTFSSCVSDLQSLKLPVYYREYKGLSMYSTNTQNNMNIADLLNNIKLFQ